MNAKSRVFFGISCLLIMISAFFTTSWYISDLEMLWLAAFLIVPVWAVGFGYVISFMLQFLTKTDKKYIIWVVAFSLLVHVGLLVEETSVSAIRQTFDNRAKVLNEKERSRSIHEVKLGQDKLLYFKNNKDTDFELNFEFEGRKIISKDRIFALAEQWLVSKGYGISETRELQTYSKYYRKGISFDLENPGEILLTFTLADGPGKPEGRLKKIMLALKFKKGAFVFEERGWV